jgi:hypothetical protein
MTEQVDVTEAVEGEEAPYNAYDDLCKRKSGVQCPNPNCYDRIFSYVADKSINCRCGLTWVSGGSLCLRFGVGAPFLLADVRVVSQRLEEFHPIEVEATGADAEGFEEEVAVDLGQTVEETPEDLTVGDGGDAVLDVPTEPTPEVA